MKKIIIIISVMIVGILIGLTALRPDSEKTKDATSTSSVKEVNKIEPSDDLDEAGAYISYDSFTKEKDLYKDDSKVLFFHASWCPICQSIHKEIEDDPGKLPKEVTIIKTDFDTQTKARQKYGVTTQYTFVQIDNDGNELAQWSATNLDNVLSNIKP